MGVIQRLFRPEQRAIDKMALWGQGADIGDEVDAGVAVSQDTAMRLIPVYACIRVNSETLASLPADAVRSRSTVPGREPVPRPPRWIDTPNPETTWFELVQRVVQCLLLDGNAFVLITARDAQGYPQELWTLNPRDVDVKRTGNGRTRFVFGGTVPLSRFGPDNPAGDVLHIKLMDDGYGRGMSPIEQARQGIGLGLASEKSGSKLFGQGMQMPGVIELPAMNAQNTQVAVDAMQAAWQARHGGTDNAHKPGVITGGGHWNSISVTPEQAQFLETRKFQVIEIARLYGTPPIVIGEVDVQSSWGTGVEQQVIGWYRFGLLPQIIRLEQGFSQLMPRGQYLKLNVKGLLRGDLTAQTEAYVKAVTNGWMSRAEVRELEDMPPEDGLDEFLYPASETPLSAAPTGPPSAAPVAPGGPADALPMNGDTPSTVGA